MEQMKTNWLTMGPALLGGLKLILQPFGITIPDENINQIVNGVAAVLTVGGIIYHHLKAQKEASASAQSSNTIGYNK